MPNELGIPYGAAREFTTVKFKGPLNWVETNFAVTAVTQQIVKGNADRMSLTFCNNGAGDMFIGLSNLVFTVGIKIVNSGQIINFNTDDDGELPSLTWYAVSAATTSCYVLEGIQSAYLPTPATTQIKTRNPFTEY